jgi:hypothetical protein
MTGRQVLEGLIGAELAKVVYDAGYVCVPRTETSEEEQPDDGFIPLNVFTS